MKSRLQAVILAIVLVCPAFLFAADAFDYAPYARLLRNHVTENGFVHYARLQADRADLDAFVAQLERISPENAPQAFPSQDDQLAYWINAYNALALRAVVDRYPVRSIRDISFLFGFFWRMKHTVGGKRYTLNHIEHGILRTRYLEPRIHFAINCASASCPKLAREPYLPDTLDQQLDEAARTFIGESRNVRPEPEMGRIHLSMIFNWYLDDFRKHLRQSEQKSQLSVLDYIQLYAAPELKSYLSTRKPKIRYISYDWSLNDAGKK